MTGKGGVQGSVTPPLGVTARIPMSGSSSPLALGHKFEPRCNLGYTSESYRVNLASEILGKNLGESSARDNADRPMGYDPED